MRGKRRARIPRRGSRSAIIAFAAGAVASSAARADESPAIRLDYTATADAASCGTAADLRARIAERLGRDPFGESNAGPTLRIRVARAAKRWTAAITLLDARGATRGAKALEESGATCEPLVRSVAFTVSVLLEDLPSAAPEPAPSAPPPPPAPAAPEPNPFAEPAPAPAPPPSPPPPRVRVDGALSAALALGSAPAPAAGLDATFGLDFAEPGARIELGGRALLPASSNDAVGVRTRLLFARAAPCWGVPLLSGCIAFGVGSLSGEGTGEGVASGRLASQLYAAAGPALASRVFVGDTLFVRIAAELWVPLTRAGFDVGTVRAFTLPAVSGAGTLGVGARLP